MSINKKPIIIHIWCGPRTLSTCLMYSFNQRSDCVVFDEPLYASYLYNNPNVTRPYRDELLQSQDINCNSFLEKLTKITDKPIVICKHMSKHYSKEINKALLSQENVVNIILMRNPLDMIRSWEAKNDVHNEVCSIESMGLTSMLQIFVELRQLTNKSPLVIDSDLLKVYPVELLQDLCFTVNIPYDENQLHWPKGPKPCDGIWAKYWYDSVHQSVGFNSFVESSNKTKEISPLTSNQLTLYREALPIYQLLQKNALGVDKLNPGSSYSYYHSIQLKENRLSDIKNENILIWVGNQLLPREYAKVSVFDSAVQGGDAVWEGVRIYNHRIFMLDEHINRLLSSAKAMNFKNIPSKNYIINAIVTTLKTNGMYDNSHIRLTLTRGPKISSSMNPNFNIFGCNLLVVPEWKQIGDMTTYNNNLGVSLITACNRRNPPQCVDSKIHHNNLINNILPKIQANNAGAADALMLDLEGFVSETNATNIFLVKDNIVYTPHADYCLPGITRQTVMSLVKTTLKLEMIEKRLSLTEFYTADEVFTTGTMGEITPVISIDNRTIGINEIKGAGDITKLIQIEYRKLTETLGYVF